MGKEAAPFGSGLGPGGILEPTPKLDSWNVRARQADRASHNPPTATSAAITRNRCFGFIGFVHFRNGIMLGFWELTFDLERKRGILVRSGKEQE